MPPLPSRAAGADALEAILAACRDCPRGKRTEWLKPLKECLAEAEFLISLARARSETDPLAEDWEWVRAQMTALLGLARDFEAAFTEAKRELGMLDFHDLEQYALRLLWDTATAQPTHIARQWRNQLRFVFVDEYQDINAAQDKIIETLSRDGARANRFLVGDVKQSIYRFRLADPHIFQGYVTSWGGDSSAGLRQPFGLASSAPMGEGQQAGDLLGQSQAESSRHSAGQAIPLVDNFRSREGLLQFVNSLFTVLMRRELGGVQYDEQARLRFGAAEERRPLSCAVAAAPCVELHLRVKGAAAPEVDDLIR